MMLAVTLLGPARSSAYAQAGAGPETTALLVLRRWLVLISCTTLVVAGVIFASYEGLRVAPAERAMLGLSVALMVGAWTSLRLGPALLWCVPAATTALALTALVSGPDTTDWLPLVSAASFTGYGLALLLPLRRRWIAVPAAGALLAWTWSGRPSNVVSGALELLGGWPSVAQVMLGTAGVAWAWGVLRREAAQADAEVAASEARADDAAAREARARVWRATATRVHESVLNTIRYVQAVGAVDSDRLRQQIRVDLAEPEQLASDSARHTRELHDEVLAELDRDPAVAQRVALRRIDDVPVGAEEYDVLRSITVELVRNAVVHGRAGVVDVRLIGAEGSAVELSVDDDGDGFDSATRPGIGLSTVLGAQVEQLGGSLTMGRREPRGTRAVVSLPGQHDAAADVPGSFDQGRLLITAPIAAQTLACIAGIAALALVGERNGLLGAAAALACVVISVLVVLRRRRLSAGTAFALALPAVAVPWLLLTSEWRCAESAAVAPVVSVSGFLLVVVLAWSRPLLVGIPTVGLWAIGAALLTVEFDASCREAVGLATLNSLVGLPVILACVALALRIFRRADARARALRRREAVERARAQAAVELNAELHSAVGEAVAALDAVAATGTVSDPQRAALALADGRIRAAIQLDPASAGGLALAARQAVEDAARSGRPVAVRALLTSEDRRPVPAGLQGLLAALLGAAAGQGPAASTPNPALPTLQAFTDGEEDHLSLLVCSEALAAAGLVPGTALDLDDVVVEVDDEPERGAQGERWSVLVSRPVRPALAEPLPLG